MSKITIIEGNSDDKDQIRNYLIKGEKGEDGVSPTVETSKTGGVTTVTITDAEGTHTATINDGTDGQDGQDGADGVSPTITSSKVGSTTTLTIVDAEGTHTATIKDGETANIINSTTLSDNTTETYSGRIIDEKLGNVFPEVVTVQTTWTGGSSATFDLPSGYNSSNFTVLNIYLGANHSMIYDNGSDGLIFTKSWLVNSSNKLVANLITTNHFPSGLSTTVYAELLKTS